MMHDFSYSVVACGSRDFFHDTKDSALGWAFNLDLGYTVGEG
jgi:hypothetical protein